MIKTSVIIPVYNTEEYIGACLESILNQTQKEVEIIVVDDGSTDRSLEIVSEYQKKNNDFIVICQENKKQGAARNLGMSLANGQYLYFMDSDDLLDSNALEILYNKAVKNALDFVTFDLKCFGGNEEEKLRYRYYDRSELRIEDKVYSGVEFWNNFYNKQDPLVSPCSVYLSKEFVNKFNMEFQEKLFYEDNEFMVKAYLKASRIMYIPEKFYNRRIRQESTMMSTFSYFHFKGILSNVKLIFHHIKNDKHDISEKESFIKFWGAQLRKASRLWMDFEGEEKKELTVMLRECFDKMLEDSFLPDVLNKQLYQEIKEFIRHILLGEYLLENVQKVEKVLDEWYEDNIELFQNGYSEKYLRALKSRKGVILYGAGIVGQRVANQFQLKYWENVIGFAVSDISNCEKKICGLQVFSIEELLEYKNSANVFITTGPQTHKEIEENLLKMGFENIYPIEWRRLMESAWI